MTLFTKTVLFAASALLVVGVALVLIEPEPAGDDDSATVAEPEPRALLETETPLRDDRARKAELSQRNRRQMEIAIAEVVESDRASSASAVLESYLDELVQRARQRGTVGALDVEPGMRAIDERMMDLGARRAEQLREAFSRRMLGLAAQLDPEAFDEAAPMDFDSLLIALANSAAGPKRQAALARCLRAVDGLDPDAQPDALERIQAVVSQEQSGESPSPPDWSGLEDAVLRAEGDARGRAIQAYIAAAGTLEPSAHDEKMARLDRLLRDASP